MKYVLLGQLSSEWAARQEPRLASVQEKLAELGIKLDAVYYTQGRFDFVDIVDTPTPEALLTFTIWYATEGFGRIQSMPAFEPDTLLRAIENI
jgi:uncharacterized protein with GYD domain